MSIVFDGDERIGVYYSTAKVTTLPGTLAVYRWDGAGYVRDGEGFIADPGRLGRGMSDCLGSAFAVAGEFMRQIVTPATRSANVEPGNGFSKPAYVIVKAFKGVQPAYDSQLGRLMVSFSLPAILDGSRMASRDDDFKVCSELTEANSTSLMLLFMMLAGHLSAGASREEVSL